MIITIGVDGERFTVATRADSSGRPVYDFTWIDGPAETNYGFTFGPAVAPGENLPLTELEREALLFIQAFFSEGGIGATDFPGFVTSRQSQAPD